MSFIKRTAVRIAILTTTLLAACATQPDIHSDYDHTANFASYRTYGIMDRAGQSAGGASYETITAQRIRAAVEREMEARGYTKSPTPDILVNFYVTVKQVQKVSQVPVAPQPTYGYGYRRYNTWPGQHYETWVRNYNEGSLMIDIVDAKTNQLVWEGVGRGRLTQSEIDNIGQIASDAVSTVMSQYQFRAAP
jgi:hypothetical protein